MKMKMIKDLITLNKPVLITHERNYGGPPGSEEITHIDLCSSAQSMVNSINSFFVKYKFDGYTLEEFSLTVSQNPHISGEIYLDIEIEDGKMSNLANALAMTIQQLAETSESENNFIGWSKDIKKDSIKFGEFYDPSVFIKIKLTLRDSYHIITCEQIPFDKEKHDNKVIEEIEKAGAYISEPY